MAQLTEATKPKSTIPVAQPAVAPESNASIRRQLKSFQEFMNTVDIASLHVEDPDVDIEYELRFGSADYYPQSNTFGYKPSISEISYQSIKTRLDAILQQWPESMLLNTSVYHNVSYGIKSSTRFTTEYALPNVLEFNESSRSAYTKVPAEINGKPVNYIVERLPIRFSISYEREAPATEEPTLDQVESQVQDGAVVQVKRRIDRRSYTITNKDSFLTGWRIDLSQVVKTTRYKNAPIHRQSTYELEFERVKSVRRLSDLNLIPVMLIGLSLVQLQLIPLEACFLKTKRANFDGIIDGDEVGATMSYVQRFLTGSPQGGLNMNALNKPVNLELKSIMDPNFSPFVTVKVDGQRCLLVVLDGQVYVCMRSANIMTVLRLASPGKTYTIEKGRTTRKEYAKKVVTKGGKKYRVKPEEDVVTQTFDLPNGIFDAEWYIHKSSEASDSTMVAQKPYTIFIFDTLMVNDVDYRPYLVEKRLFASKQYPFSQLQSSMVDFSVKSFQTPNQRDPSSHARTDQVVLSLTDAMRVMPPTVDTNVVTDGYIFYANEAYTWVDSKNARQVGKVYKYKPPELLTLDFLVILKEGQFFLQLHYKPEQQKMYNAFVKTMGHRLILSSSTSLGDLHILQVLDRVGEFHYDTTRELFILDRVRPDKQHGNNIQVAWSVWRDIQQPIRPETMVGNDLVLMRRFHNDYKASMLKKYGHGIVLVDIGSGRGGDLQKWKNSRVAEIYSIEPNAENRAEFEKRFKTMKSPKPKVHLLNYGAENAELILGDHGIPISTVRLVTSFFSLTYFFKEESMIDGLVAWLEECPKGTRFIGALLDGDRVVDALNLERSRQNMEGENEFVTWETKAFSIRQTDNLDPNQVFGKKVVVSIAEESSMVHDQEEYITNFPYLRGRLQDAGFVDNLESVGSFLDHEYSPVFNTLNTYGQEWSRLNRYFVFTKMTDPASADIMEAPIKHTQTMTAPYAIEEEYVPQGTKLALSRIPEVTPLAGYIHLYPFGFPGSGKVRKDDQWFEERSPVEAPGYHPLLLAFRYMSSQSFRKAIHSGDLKPIQKDLAMISGKLVESITKTMGQVMQISSDYPEALTLPLDQLGPTVLAGDFGKWTLVQLKDLRQFMMIMEYQIKPALIGADLQDQIRRQQEQDNVPKSATLLLSTLLQQNPNFLQWTVAELNQHLETDTLQQAINDLYDRLDSTVYKGLDLERLTIQQVYTLFQPTPIRPMESADVYSRFMKMVASPTEQSRIPSRVLAYLISRIQKSAIVVLTTTGNYWSVTDSGLSLNDAMEYKWFIPIYQPPNKRTVYYPLIVRDLPLTESGYAPPQLSVQQLIMWTQLQSPQDQKTDDLYLKALDRLDAGRALVDSIVRPSQGSQQMLMDVPLALDRLTIIQQTVGSIHVQLQAIDTDLAAQRVQEVDDMLTELESLRDQLQKGRASEEEEDEDVVIDQMMRPREEPEVEEVEVEHDDMYDPAYG